MSNTIGIDLGTCNSAAAVASGRDNVEMVESRYGKTIFGKNFPSFVLFDHNGKKQVVGKLAKADLGRNPKLVIWGVKRLVGLSFKEAQAKGELKRFKYDIEEGPGGSILIQVGNERYSPSHILEFILREIKEDAGNPRINDFPGTIEKAVVSVPAYFKAPRTRPIKDAAIQAGFSEVDTIAEPTAAAVMYGIKISKEARLLAFDIGAGTLDVTVMDIVDCDGELIPGELSTSGHEALGGIDMDEILTSYIIKKYQLSGIENDLCLMGVLNDEVENAKIRLSSSSSKATPLSLPDKRIVDLTRKELEVVLKPLIEKCRGPIHVALEQAELVAKDLDHVLFVGGPSYMPCVRWVVKDELKRLGAKKELLNELEVMEKSLPINPMECVAQGASLKAGKIIEMGTTTIPEGYGTIWYPVEGLPDYYAEIIKENSYYQISGISGKGSISHNNPYTLAVSVPIYVKRPDTETAKSNNYKYFHLGDVTIGITPNGELPNIDILLQIADDKTLIIILVHTQTGEKVRFEELNELKGEEKTLQEHTPPKLWTDEDVKGSGTGDTTRKQGWTTKHLEHLIHAAQQSLELVKDSSNSKVGNKMEEVRAAIDKAVNSNDPALCPKIFDRTQELLNILSLKNINQITKEEEKAHTGKLKEITRMKL